MWKARQGAESLRSNKVLSGREDVEYGSSAITH